MDTASRPSTSAIAMAGPEHLLPVQRLPGAAGPPRSRRRGGCPGPFPARADHGPGADDCSGADHGPRADFVSTRPSSRSVAITLVAVATATPHRWAISRMDGILSPGRRSPLRILARISATICR